MEGVLGVCTVCIPYANNLQTVAHVARISIHVTIHGATEGQGQSKYTNTMCSFMRAVNSS